MSDPSTPSASHLRALRFRYPDLGAVLAEIAHLRSVLTLPRGTIHVVSDVHGEHKKLEHVLRNGSGSLRALVEETFGAGLDEAARSRLLSLLYYTRETFARVAEPMPAPERRAFVRTTLGQQLVLLSRLTSRFSLRHTERLFPAGYAAVFRELLVAGELRRDDAFVDALLSPYFDDDGGLSLLREASRVLRSLAAHELVVAGDLGDRGPRVDKVIEALRAQPNVTFTWGNHDAEWMGASLGQPALVASVLRISLRYGRIGQIEEGYGIPVEPIEQLVRAAYADDPAARFASKGSDLRDPLLLARMQKAMTIVEQKLIGQTTRRNPQFALEHRNLLHRIDRASGTVEIDGKRWPLLDTAFPTLDPADPYALSPAEAECMEHLCRSFRQSAPLRRDMQWVAERGAMFVERDELLVFHGCVPTEPDGSFASFPIDGAPRSGRALYDAFEEVVRRAFRFGRGEDLDLLWYLWAGPRAPTFGKDRMATFESYFVADKSTHKETKDPYFAKIHERSFCEAVAREMGVAAPERVLIVNGHVPVKLEEGESPLKRSGLAVTIDGAFSEAYGDHGYTLVAAADRTYLAKHHHFESIERAISAGEDIVPEVTELRRRERPMTVAESAAGERLAEELAALEALAAAMRSQSLGGLPET